VTNSVRNNVTENRQRRVGLYFRISKDGKGKGLGVKRQDKECREYATQIDWADDIVDVYCDNDLSGWAKNVVRDDWERLRADIESGRINAILCWHSDRCTRRPREIEDVIDYGDEGDLEFASKHQGVIDLRSADGQDRLRQDAYGAARESRHRSERVKSASRDLAEQGLSMGGQRPFGFLPGGLELDEAEAELVREATRRVLAGEALSAICRDWGQREIVSAGGKPFSITTLRALVSRWRNCGLKQYLGEVIGPAAWPAIVSKEEVTATRLILENPARLQLPEGRDRARKHQLSFIPLCLACGEGRLKFTASRSAKKGPDYFYESYSCSSLHCFAGVSKDVLEEVVIEHLVQRLTLPTDGTPGYVKEEDPDALAFRLLIAKTKAQEQQVIDADLEPEHSIPLLRKLSLQRKELEQRLSKHISRDALAEALDGLLSVFSTTEDGRHLASLEAGAEAQAAVREKFLSMGLAKQRSIITSLMTIEVRPAGPARSRQAAKERIVITPIDPRTGESYSLAEDVA
jgi:site-specific DNA recombinase